MQRVDGRNTDNLREGGIKCARRHLGRFMKYADVHEVAEEWEKPIIFLYGRIR
jgi:hypothetical protein